MICNKKSDVRNISQRRERKINFTLEFLAVGEKQKLKKDLIY